MPALTRRRHPERPDCWHVYYSDVHVGTIAVRSGVPKEVDQWGWTCGFYPLSHRGVAFAGTAETFESARADFEWAWRDYLPKCTEADFLQWREAQAWTDWKYRMLDTRHRLPTQTAAGRSKCFCGAEIAIADTADHVRTAHMKAA
jgi:hypothetical protein